MRIAQKKISNWYLAHMIFHVILRNKLYSMYSICGKIYIWRFILLFPILKLLTAYKIKINLLKIKKKKNNSLKFYQYLQLICIKFFNGLFLLFTLFLHFYYIFISFISTFYYTFMSFIYTYFIYAGVRHQWVLLECLCDNVCMYAACITSGSQSCAQRAIFLEYSECSGSRTYLHVYFGYISARKHSLEKLGWKVS